MIIISREGNMYGFEKLWAFLKFRKGGEKLDLAADLQAELVKFKTADDFHAVAASLSCCRKVDYWD